MQGRPAKSVQAVKISTKRDGTVVHKVLKQRWAHLAPGPWAHVGPAWVPHQPLMHFVTTGGAGRCSHNAVSLSWITSGCVSCKNTSKGLCLHLPRNRLFAAVSVLPCPRAADNWHRFGGCRGGRIARQNQGNLGGLGNSIPLSLLPDGIQAPKLAGYDATPRQGNVRRRNSQHSQQVAANEGGNTIRAVPLQLGRGSGATPSRNGRGSGGRGGPMAMASESRESVPREVPNVRVTFQNTRPVRFILLQQRFSSLLRHHWEICHRHTSIDRSVADKC